MIFIVFFVLALLSLFGFGQIMGAHKNEKNVASTALERAQNTRKAFLERLKNRISGPQKPKWWEFWKPKEAKKGFFKKIFDIGDQGK